MYCINLESTDPFFNLAIEEVLLRNSMEEYLILGINSPSVIIGKHQSSHMEVDTKYVTENDIPVLRRISGGGTVFHDYGNLNFTFIRQSESGKQVDLKFEGKNDLKVGGLKISGNAEHVHRNRVLHHGTLLYSSSLNRLRCALRKDNSCYTSRAVKSNPSSVMNLNDIPGMFQNIYEFRDEMMNYMMKILPETKSYQLSDSETAATEDLVISKYKSWEWNWAYGPEYYFVNKFEVTGELFVCRMFVKDGIIQECKIEGSDEMADLAKKLTGCRHMVTDLREILRKENNLLSDIDIFKFF